MASLLNRARMTTATTGTGTVTLGSAMTRFATFAEAGAVNSTSYSYVIDDGNDFELGTGTYTSAGTTFSRDTVIFSKIGGVAGTSKINLSGNATIGISFITGSNGFTPVGSIIISPIAAALPGTLVCNGSAVSRTTYALLFAVIGTAYGVGDGATTFNLPDYRGEFLRGFANGSANDPDAASRTDRGDGTTGDNIGTKQGYEIQSHLHTVPRTATAAGGGAQFQTAAGSTTNTGSTGGNETRPRNVYVNYCIVYQ